jgi:hypothetical protein
MRFPIDGLSKEVYFPSQFEDEVSVGEHFFLGFVI